jgi:hypothetical protein
MRDSFAQLNILMNPGHTAIPLASISWCAHVVKFSDESNGVCIYAYVALEGFSSIAIIDHPISYDHIIMGFLFAAEQEYEQQKDGNYFHNHF